MRRNRPDGSPMAQAVARLLMACAVATLAASCEVGIDGDLQGSEIHGADAQVDDEPGDAGDLLAPDAAEEPGLDAAVDVPDAGHSRPDAGPSHPDAGQSRPDASQPHPDAGAKGFRIASFSVSPTQIAQGGSVKVATTITSFGGATLSDGVLEVPSTGPDGVVRAGTTSGIDLGANETKVVEQTRGAYQMVGVWKFHATLKDSAGQTLATGPATGVSFTVVASPTVEVIILQNQYTGTLGVPATESAMDQSNANNWLPGVKFHYTTSATINTSTLSGKDVLVMPGGSSGYDYYYNSGISGADVRGFVHAGGGYVGTCAGAYAGVANVDGYGYG